MSPDVYDETMWRFRAFERAVVKDLCWRCLGSGKYRPIVGLYRDGDPPPPTVCERCKGTGREPE